MNTTVKIGNTFGRLVVLTRLPNDRHGKTRWSCICACGTKTEVVGAELRNGDTVSCGCIRLDMGKDMLGLKIGKLEVIGRTYTNGSKKWQCVCDCGGLKYLATKDLDGIRYKSCGCDKGVPKIPNIERMINSRYKSYRYNSSKKNREFQLTRGQFGKLVQTACYYCGSMDSRKNIRAACKIPDFRRAEYVNGIDRIDSTRGYTEDNTVPCCKMCNKMKMEFTLEDWLEQINKIHRRHCNGMELGRTDRRGT